MNTNREAIVNLISLLVKKAGFNFNDNNAKDELVKIKESIDKLTKEKLSSDNKENIQKLIDNLKQRQNFWEESAQIIGSELINAYDDKKSVNEVKAKINRLANLASDATENLQVSYIYSRISELEKETSNLRTIINNNNYVCEEEKDMDLKYKSYLENKISSIDEEIKKSSKELEVLKESEERDLSIINKIKDYNESLNNNLNTVENIFHNNIDSEITFDVWERLEITRNSLEEKISKSKDVLNKTENMLENIRKNQTNLSLVLESLEDEKKKCNNKLNNVNNKLEKNDYINITKKILDISNYEMMKVEIESLKNKKDVIYVDADKVEQELLKAWNNEEVKVVINDKKETDIKIESQNQVETNEIEETKVDITNEIKKEETIKDIEKKNKYELDW